MKLLVKNYSQCFAEETHTSMMMFSASEMVELLVKTTRRQKGGKNEGIQWYKAVMPTEITEMSWPALFLRAKPWTGGDSAAKDSPYTRTWVQLPKCRRHGCVPLESQYRGQETEWSLSSLVSQSNRLGRLQDNDKSCLKGHGLCSWEWHDTQNCAHAHASTHVLAHIHILKRIKTKKEQKYSIIGKQMHYYFSIYTMSYYKTI